MRCLLVFLDVESHREKYRLYLAIPEPEVYLFLGRRSAQKCVQFCRRSMERLGVDAAKSIQRLRTHYAMLNGGQTVTREHRAASSTISQEMAVV
jgi:hypothetical protein